MRRLGQWASFLSLLLLTGCAISPGPEVMAENMCRFTRHSLDVEVREDAAKTADENSFAAALRRQYSDMQLDRGGSDISPSLLILSGGSQNGAFGAGFLDQWATERKGGLPRFKVVTGISTGAILSTFAFVNRTDLARSEYAIDKESLVLKALVRGGGRISLFDAPTIARRGAMGELSPLRGELRRLIDGPMLERIATEGAAGRKLYMGAVDVDTGQAVIFDMTEMAARYDSKGTNLEHVRNCYVEAVIASSSVPLAATPAFIDNRMYIDGGARFGVFSDEIGDVIVEKSEGLKAEFDRRLTAKTLTADPQAYVGPNIFVLINGTLTVEEQCGKAAAVREADGKCPGGHGALAGRHADWDLLSLAQRSVAILIDQTYRFSALDVTDGRPRVGFRPWLQRIKPDVADYGFVMDDRALGSGKKKCSEWKAEDVKLDRPLEFHPRYMHCLIAYGRSRATASGWAGYE